ASRAASFAEWTAPNSPPSANACSIRSKFTKSRVRETHREPRMVRFTHPTIMTQQLRLGIPAGSLQEATAELFRNAGFKITFASRSYYPSIDDPEIHCTLIRAQEMPRYVEAGSLDCGLTGHDWVLENEAKVTQLAELVFSKVSRRPVRWVLAVPNDSPIESVQDLRGKRIATEIVGITRRWLAEHGVEATVEFSWGAT